MRGDGNGDQPRDGDCRLRDAVDGAGIQKGSAEIFYRRPCGLGGESRNTEFSERSLWARRPSRSRWVCAMSRTYGYRLKGGSHEEVRPGSGMPASAKPFSRRSEERRVG